MGRYLISNNSPDNGSNGQINWDSQYVQLGSGWEFTRAGRYDSGSNYPNEPSNQTSAQDSIYPVANLGFDLPVPVPEPGTLSLAGIGAVLLFGLASLRKAFLKPIDRNQN
jgi:PEP-CTERM motif